MGEPGPRGVRLIDVAREAGVAPGTASKALNDSGQLREETRRRVRDAASRLGFVDDRGRRPPSSARTFTVALLTGDSIGRFSIPILLGAENALSADEFLVLLCDSHDDPLREQHYLRHLLARRVEGLIITGRRSEPRPPVRMPIPVVYAYAPSRDDRDSSVAVDEGAGARLVVDHLVSLGRTRIAHITGPADHRSARIRADMLSGRAAELGVPLVRPPLFGEWSEPWGRAAVDALLGRHPAGSGDRASGSPALDAIACGSDQIARGVTERLRERGVAIPADVAVTGFDDWDVMAEGARPPLTTVDLRLDAVGRRAAELLLDAIAGRPHSGTDLVMPRLVSRASTLGVG